MAQRLRFPVRGAGVHVGRLLGGSSRQTRPNHRLATRGPVLCTAARSARLSRCRRGHDCRAAAYLACGGRREEGRRRSEEHTSELQSRLHLVCRLLLEKKKKNRMRYRVSCCHCSCSTRGHSTRPFPSLTHTVYRLTFTHQHTPAARVSLYTHTTRDPPRR